MAGPLDNRYGYVGYKHAPLNLFDDSESYGMVIETPPLANVKAKPNLASYYIRQPSEMKNKLATINELPQFRELYNDPYKFSDEHFFAGCPQFMPKNPISGEEKIKAVVKTDEELKSLMVCVRTSLLKHFTLIEEVAKSTKRQRIEIDNHKTDYQNFIEYRNATMTSNRPYNTIQQMPNQMHIYPPQMHIYSPQIHIYPPQMNQMNQMSRIDSRFDASTIQTAIQVSPREDSFQFKRRKKID